MDSNDDSNFSIERENSSESDLDADLCISPDRSNDYFKEDFRNNAVRKELECIFVTYHMDTTKATDVKDSRLYECFVTSGGFSFLEYFKVFMFDVLSQNLKSEVQKKIWICHQAGPRKTLFNYAN
jgi:hypothetical protein